MSKKVIGYDKEALSSKYAEIHPRYERLAINLRQALYSFLQEANIDILDISYRIKNYIHVSVRIRRKFYSIYC